MADSDSDASLESVDVALADFVERARARVGRGEVKLAPTVDEAPARRSMSPERPRLPDGATRPSTPPASVLPDHSRTFFASPPTPDRHQHLSNAVRPSPIEVASFTLPPVPPTPSRPHATMSSARRMIITIHDTDSESDGEPTVPSTPGRSTSDVRADEGSDDDIAVVEARRPSEAGILHWDPASLRPTPKAKAKPVARKASRPILHPISAVVQPAADDPPVASTSMLPPAPLATPRRRKKAPAPDSFAARRDTLAAELVADLDRTVFGGRLPDGLVVSWNARLTTTAGFAQLKAGAYSVQLSDKVVDGEDRLKHTLAHELCHIASWAVDREMKPPHGPAFSRWAQKVMVVRPDITVSTTHSYAIAYKYSWRCEGCGSTIGRHSKSIDVTRQACGGCHGKLELVSAPGRAGAKLAAARKAKPTTGDSSDGEVAELLRRIDLTAG